MKEAFVYSWKNKTTNCLYIGWHKGSVDDGYICSSKPMLEEYRKNPDNFERFIIAHGSADDMIKLEQKLLTAVDAKNDLNFYNQTNGNSEFICKIFTEQHRSKISKANKGRKHSAEAKCKMKNNYRSKGMLGRKHSAETIAKMKLSQMSNKELLSKNAKKQWESRKTEKI